MKKAKGVNSERAICNLKRSVLVESSQGVSTHHRETCPSSPPTSEAFFSDLMGSHTLEFRSGVPENVPGQMH